MPRNWMDRLRKKLTRFPRRRKATWRGPVAQTLEERTYLSVSSLFAGGELQIIADADDNIVLGIDPASPGTIQLTVNGTVEPSFGRIQASEVRALTIIGSDTDNLIDISAVSSTDFTFVDPDTNLGLQIFIDGDDGDDVIFGSRDFDDTLSGGNGEDVINVGLTIMPTGNQTIDGGDGDDTIQGGDGNDVIDSGDGDDAVAGGDGNDTITGDDGADILTGEDGDDSIFGDDGADTINGGDGTDMVNGGSGTDSVSGDAGNDTVYGGAGDDQLFGDAGSVAGDDVIYGNSGDDQINGGGGNDLLDGGSGDDFVVTIQSQFAILETNVNVAEGAAGGGTVANFTITLSASLPTATSVDVSTMDGTAIAGQDYVATSLTLVFNPGVTSQQVSVPLIGDSISEPTEMFSLVLTNPVGAQLGNATATATIQDDDVGQPPVLPTISIGDASVTEGNTGTSMLAFTLTLSAASTSTVTVSAATSDGSATAGSDYVASTGTVTFTPGMTTATFTTTINGDTMNEADESFNVTLSNPVNATILDGTAIGTILNDDGTTLPSLSIADVSVTEGNTGTTTASFTVTLSAAAAGNVTVMAATSDITATAGQDYVANTQTLTFPAGTTTQTFDVTVNGDTMAESDETFMVTLSNPTGAALGGMSTATGTITDDDSAPSNFDIVVVFEGGLTTTQMAAFTTAEQRLEQIITGDVPDVTVPGIGLVDDIQINARGVAIDGPGGILGQAGPNAIRPGTSLPVTGDMEFDSADLAALEASGELGLVILHEMLHVIGIGTIWDLTGNLTGAGGPDPQFTGAMATAEYNTIFGINAASVPVENQGGPGTADGHFRESVFDNELMTGFLNSGEPNPLSRITVGSLADIGYQVDLNQADMYTAPSLRANSSSSPKLRMIAAMAADESMIVPDEWMRMGADPDQAMAALTPQEVIGNANIVTTVTFDEVPFQPVDGLTVGEVTYGFTINGVPSTDADYASFGPNLVNFLQDPVLEGNATGVLSLDFSTPVDSIQFGLARSIQAPVTNGVEVRLFDSAGNPAGTFPLNLTTPVSFAEVQFSYSGLPVQRMEIDLTVATPAQAGTRFAIDNLIYNTVDAVATPSATVFGGSGNDTLIASDGDDILNGGGGNDAIDGGNGNDTILGGAGSDTLFGSDGNDRIRGQGGMDLIEGGNGDDSIDGDSSRDTIYGDDALDATTGNDTINGGSDNDSLFGGSGDDSILGGAGRDTLSGDAGDDTLNGQGGDDELDGGTGDDTIDSDGNNDGDDTVIPGDGGDAIVVTGSSADDTFTVSQSGSDLVIRRGSSSITIPTTGLAAGVETVIVNAGNGNDTINIGNLDQVGLLALLVNGEGDDDTISALGAAIGSVRFRIDGGTGDDTLTGSDDADTILGGEGLDVISGNNGNDTLMGGDDADSISGGNGDDTIDGNNGNDTVLGDAGDDSLLGSFGNDMMVGDVGDDTLNGGFGDDLLNGMSGDDSLLGSNGNDRIAGGVGEDTISGGNDNDTIQAHSGADLIDGAHGDDLIFGQAGDDTIFGDDGNDTIMGGNGQDLIFGQDGDDVIDGESSTDTIHGGDGHDTLRGGGSDDTLIGHDGDDVINGNSGTDTASTGEGADTTNNVEVIDESFMLSSEMMRDFDTLANE